MARNIHIDCNLWLVLLIKVISVSYPRMMFFTFSLFLDLCWAVRSFGRRLVYPERQFVIQHFLQIGYQIRILLCTQQLISSLFLLLSGLQVHDRSSNIIIFLGQDPNPVHSPPVIELGLLSRRFCFPITEIYGIICVELVCYDCRLVGYFDDW